MVGPRGYVSAPQVRPLLGHVCMTVWYTWELEKLMVKISWFNLGPVRLSEFWRNLDGLEEFVKEKYCFG